MKLTLDHLRDYMLPQRRIGAQRSLDKISEGDETSRYYWQGYFDAIRSLEDTIKEILTNENKPVTPQLPPLSQGTLAQLRTRK